jgi:hypothetical protein
MITKRKFISSILLFFSGIFTSRGFSQSNPQVLKVLHGVEILKRSGWNAAAPNWDRLAPLWRGDKVKYVTVHHTATAPRAGFAPLQTIKSNQNYHMGDKNWGDVAYHFMVTPDGKIYEARSPKFASDSHGAYLTKKQWESAPAPANGVTLFPFSDHAIQAPGASHEHINIAFVGDFYKSVPTAAAIASVEALVAALIKEYGLKVEGDSGVQNLCFHREIGSTQCPGDFIYRHFRGDQMKRSGIGTGIKNIRTKLGA